MRVVTVGFALAIAATCVASIAAQRLYDLEDAETLVPRSFGVSWLADGQSYSRRSGDSILRQDVSSSPPAAPETILDGNDLPDNLRGYSSFTLSRDLRFAALATNPTNNIGSPFKANYFVFDTATRSAQPITTSDDQVTQQMSPSFSIVGEKVAFARSNNVFLRDLATGAPEVQVTADARRSGDVDEVSYGMSLDELYAPDPMDGEHSSRDLKIDFNAEVDETRTFSFQWSTDGRHLSFLRTDRSEVPIFNYMVYNDGLYPEVINLPYSMAAEPNPKVEVAIYDIDADCLEFVDLEALLGYGPGDLIITEVFWAESGELAIRATNRLQQNQWLIQVDVSGNKCRHYARVEQLRARIAFEREDAKWVVSGYRGTGSLVRIPGTELVLDITNDADGWRHIAITDTSLNGDQTPKFVTSGQWEVTNLVGFHAPTERIFFLSTISHPTERHLSSIRLDGTQRTLISPRTGAFYSASMSPTAEYYLLNFQGASGASTFYEIPTSTLFSTVNTSYAPIVLEDNAAFAAEIRQLELPRREILGIGNLADPQTRPIYATITYPVGYTPSQRYPILVYIYGGPDSQTVSTRHTLLESLQDRLNLYLSSHGYITASVDCRGTGARGVEFMQEIYLNLGDKETQDFIYFGQYLRERFNPTSLGIWGKSYGGYMTLKVLQKDTEGIYDAGISLAPVTDWFWYNSGYTERFMQFPEMNSENYRESAVVGDVENYRNKDLIIIHGSGDDNVHYRHAVSLFDELIEAEIYYDTIVYPNDDHALVRRRHMNRHLERWLGEKMPPPTTKSA